MALNRNTAGAQKTEYSLVEITKLGRTLKKRAADVLAYFDRPSTSNGPTEAIKCRCRHLMAYADVWIMPTVTTFTLVRDDRLLVVSA